MTWPWHKKIPLHEQEIREASEHAREIEERAERVEWVVRERDPWAAGILDVIRHRRRPNAR